MRLPAALMLVTMLLSAEPQSDAFEQAVKALGSGDYHASEEGFQKVLSTSPNHLGALQNLGLVYARTGRLDLAIATYRRALALSPNQKRLSMNLGLAYVQQEDYASALPVFQAIVKGDAKNIAARELVATCEFYTGRLAAAAAHFEAVRSEDPKNLDLLYLLSTAYIKQNQAEKMYPALGGLPREQNHFIQCRAFNDAGRPDDALEHCREAGSHRELGKVLAAQHDPGALAELTASVQQNPQDSEALYSLGITLLQENRVADAANALERAKQLRPGFWGAYFYLGKARLQMNQAAQAVPLLQRAAELNPRASVLFYELGRALKATGRTAEAEQAMTRVRELRAAELENDVKALQKR